MKEIAGLGHLFVCVFLYNFSAFMVTPAITDVMMAALCPGKDRCSLAIYLSGFQQAITGVGTLVITPVIGNLSDAYGRKTLLTVPMTISIVPLVILAYGRSTSLFYAYYVVTTFAGMSSKGGIHCLTLAYVADKVGDRRRASAFGVLSGISAAGFVCGTLVTRFIPTSLTFKVAAAVATLAAVYMRVFLDESLGAGAAPADDLTRPITAGEDCSSQKVMPERRSPSPLEMIRFLRSSLTLSQAAIIVFWSSFGDSGLQDSLLYYFKAVFHFNKDQFADLLLIIGVAGAFSQLVLMPVVVPAIGEERLLSMALLASCAHIFLYSIAWASWVPYFAATFIIASVFGQPCLRSIVSKKVGPSEQGMAQGCISGVASVANILAPFVITPLTALFLSESAPFNFPGFSILCIGFISVAAFIQSVIMMRAKPSVLIETFNCSQNV